MTKPAPKPTRLIEAQDRYEALIEATRISSAAVPYKEAVRRLLALVVRALRCSAATLWIVEEGARRLRVEARAGRKNPRSRRDELPFGRGIPGWVAAKGRPLLLPDAGGDPRGRADPARRGPAPIESALCVPLRWNAELLGVLEVVNGRGGFDRKDRVELQALGQIMTTLHEAERRGREHEEESLRFDLLRRTTLSLGRSLDLDRSLREILDSVRRLLGFDAAGVFVLDEENRKIVEKLIRGYAANQWDRVHLKVGEGVAGWAAEHGQGVVVGDVTRDARYIDARRATRSQLAAPLLSGGKVVGVLNLESDRLEAYREEDLALLEAFTNQAAVAIEMANLHAERVEHQRLERELELARGIQKSLLPRRSPTLRGYDIAGFNRPSEGVGGDYFDFIRVARGQLGIGIADVSGKGIPGALTMASLRAALRVEVTHFYAIRDILAKVSDYLWESTGPEEFATLFYGVLDAAEGVLTYASAGHNPGILLRAEGAVELLESTGTVLGAFSGLRWEESHACLEPGDTLLLFTDGVTEAADAKERQFGTERLIEVLRRTAGLPARRIGREIVREVYAFTGRRILGDDITYIVLRRNPPAG